MATDLIRYDLLTQDALRGVVKRVLADVVREGLPGDHHFYITFDTRAPGVRLSHRIREQYPQEMTVVLQHQFWDLAVTEHGFEVGLSFKGIPEKLVVPFEAVKGFFDPSVQFGLQFEVDVPEEGAPSAARTGTGDAAPAEAGRPRASEAAEAKHAGAESEAKPEAKSETRAEGAESTGAEVVSLDKFRKK